MLSVKENLEKIKEQIGNNRVKIIAVTKYADEEQIFEAYKLGIHDFGESYVQDGLEKISKKFQDEQFKKLVNWHFIGRLQKNKVKHVVGNFKLIHSVDSIELAYLINKIALGKKLIQDILLQVNISQEATKSGFSSSELKSLFGEIIILPNIKILGVMTIAPKTNDEGTIRDCFLGLASLKDEINKTHRTSLSELSMGMTNDYKIALKCGATMIRIGKGIFKGME